VIIRTALESDLPAIVEIYNSTVPSRMVTADTEPVSVESRKAWFYKHSPAKYPLWVAEIDGYISGWLSFQAFREKPAYNITAELSLYISEVYRRKGIGRNLLKRAVEYSPALGLHNLLGFIFAHNTPSLELFKNMGFEQLGRLPGVTVMDGTPRDVVIMGLQLANGLDAGGKS